MSNEISRVAEDYLQIVWKTLECAGRGASTSGIASQLGVTPSTVSANLKKLAKDGLIQYVPYGPIQLTETGRSLAVPLVRRHRLIETFLVQQLGLSWDQVHREAQELEHAVSPLVLDHMDRLLGHPTHDPHGSPIPSAEGVVVQDDSVALNEIPPGRAVSIARVSTRSPQVLQYLEEHGLVVGADVVLERVNREAGVVYVRTGSMQFELSLQVARAVRVASV